MSGANQAELCVGGYLHTAGRAPSMATCKPDFSEREASTGDRRPDGIEGGMKRNRGNVRRARARRAQARWRSQDTAGVTAPSFISTPHSLNQSRQVWRPRVSQNVRLLMREASTNVSYPADDVQGEGGNMNVDQEIVEGEECQVGALSPLAEIFSPNQLQDTTLHTPSQPPAPDQHQLPAMHDHLPAINTPPPNIIPYDVHGFVQYPPGYLPYPHGNLPYPPRNLPCPPPGNLPYPHGYLPYPPGNLPCPPGNLPYPPRNLPCPPENLPYPPGNLPCPPGYVLQYPGGPQYPYVTYTSPYW